MPETIDTAWTRFRWGVALWIMRAATAVAPNGTAKERWGEYQRVWIAEMRQAWRIRYG